jgi:ribose transport system permease protein
MEPTTKDLGPPRAGRGKRENGRFGLIWRAQFNQERIVLAIFLLAFASFCLFLPGFMSVGNVLTLMRSVAVLGMLSIGMALVVIGRGIDLSIIANLVISMGFALFLANNGHSLGAALAIGLALSLTFGLINGILVAYVEIPALFATLAFGTAIYGFGRAYLIPTDVVYLPQGATWFGKLGDGDAAGIPMPIVNFAVLALIVYAVLRFTKFGWYVYGMGENFLCARITGIPIRVVTVLQYIASAGITFLAAGVFAASVSSVNTRLFNSTMIYDVILVVVLGGISLSGGKGGVRNVVVGALLVGTLLNGMTIMDLPLTIQNLTKGVLLVIAIVIDALVNPRDEQVSQQGDI